MKQLLFPCQKPLLAPDKGSFRFTSTCILVSNKSETDTYPESETFILILGHARWRPSNHQVFDPLSSSHAAISLVIVHAFNILCS
jgi:hypothetical protein